MTAARPASPAIVILISGRGSNMLALVRAAQSGRLPVRVAAVISDRASAAGLATARELGIDCEVVAARGQTDRAAYDRELAAAVRARQPDLVVLAGFMRILGPEFTREFAGRLLNIHPSLLPAYPGLHTHARVLAAGDREHGCSVHFVTEELDGGPVVLQARVPVLAGDTEKTLTARVLAKEHQAYSLVIDWYAARRLEWRAGQVWFDGRRLEQPLIFEGEEVQA